MVDGRRDTGAPCPQSPGSGRCQPSQGGGHVVVEDAVVEFAKCETRQIGDRRVGDHNRDFEPGLLERRAVRLLGEDDLDRWPVKLEGVIEDALAAGIAREGQYPPLTFGQQLFIGFAPDPRHDDPSHEFNPKLARSRHQPAAWAATSAWQSANPGEPAAPPNVGSGSSRLMPGQAFA